MTLPCRVENKIGVIQWTRDGFGLGDTRDLSGYTRYKLIGSDDESKYDTVFIWCILLKFCGYLSMFFNISELLKLSRSPRWDWI